MTAERCTIHNTSFQFEGVKGVYHGKVRDVYDLGDQLLMVATDRISAFDHVLPKAIPLHSIFYSIQKTLFPIGG